MNIAYPFNLGLKRRKFLRKSIENQEEVVKIALTSIENHGEIRFLYFWGISPFKSEVDIYDRQAMEFLNLICSQISHTFSAPVQVTLLFGDIHAAANDIDSKHTENYAKSVKELASSFNFSFNYFSEFFSETELKDLPIPNDEILTLFEKEKTHLIRAALNGGDEKTAEKRALTYLTTRMKEREVIAQNFKNTILITSDRPRNKYILPNLPLIYTYTIKSNESKKSWFMYQNNKK